jgi:peptidoglycan/LPS O-acetylase OafA/YrhL
LNFDSAAGISYNNDGLRGKAKRVKPPRPRTITIVASLMIIFGFAEIITGFAHNFFGLHTAQGAISTYMGAGIGALYAAAGFAVLTMKRRAAMLAIMLLLIVVAGRIYMVTTGLYPVNTPRQAVAMIIGTSIAASFAIFIALRRSAFRQKD